MLFFKEHKYGIIGAAIFAVAMLLLLLLLGFTTPLPLPEERGILIDFGGGGSLNAGASSSAVSTQRNVSTSPSSNSGVVTQDIEDAASMQSSVVPNNNNNMPDNSIESTTTTTNSTPTNRLEDRLGNSNLGNIFGDGTGTGDSGSGTGSGTPGSGTGTNGAGQGPGGIGNSLEGRRQIKTVNPENKDNMFGKVELQIDVDAKGNVIYIQPLYSNCTECTQDAINAVKQWKYVPIPNSGTQTGVVTIIFDQK